MVLRTMARFGGVFFPGLLLTSILVLITSLGAPAAHAGIIFGPAFSYSETKVESGSTTSKVTETIFDLRLGHRWASGMYIGGIYNDETTKSGSSQEKGKHYGPSFGYVGTNFNIIGSYFLAGERSYTGGIKRTEVSGPQIDLAYMFGISSGLSLGPQMTWRSIEYKKIQASGIEVDNTYKLTDIRPMIALMFAF